MRTETGERPERKLQALSVWGFCAKTGKEPCDTGNPRRGLFSRNAAADARSRQNAGLIRLRARCKESVRGARRALKPISENPDGRRISVPA